MKSFNPNTTCLCARCQAKPIEKHLKEVKRIFRHLRGTANMGLWYMKDSGFELTGYLDADYAGCKDTFKSTSGGAQFLGEKLNHFFKGTIDPTLFIRRFDDDILVVQVYVDDIIFGSTNARPNIVHATCLCAQYQAKPTEKHLKEVKRIFCYLCGTVNMGLWYTTNYGFELTEYSDADYAGCKDTFKSTSDGTQFLGKNLLMDYGFHFNKIPICCDSKSAIAISCNLVQHSKTKHIIVRYHFIKENVEKGMIELYFVKTDYQLADLFTKALLVDRFNYLVCRLGMHSLSP
nr:hypothetical protein [Tanacetum cinerariifolium]